MKISESLNITFHRTVRVPDGRQPSALPPSLGQIQVYKVKDYSKNCPKNWESDGYFFSLHDTEAMWMSFSASHPVALLVGAGGINALTGEKLGTKLAKENYLVTPPQPWLDGWKDKDGTVYQFVATPYKKGKGISVAEQLIGKESKTGAIGIAVFDPKDVRSLVPKSTPFEGWSDNITSDDFNWTKPAGAYGVYKSAELISCSLGSATKGMSASRSHTMSFDEMGVGKGGKIIQKVYSDPHGLDVWKPKPSSTTAFYLVNAVVFKEITGIDTPNPVGYQDYFGHWYGMKDQSESDLPGSGKFTGLKSAVFQNDEIKVGAKSAK